MRDHGIGIDAATLPTIFDLFAQATRSLDRSHGGLGIELTLAKGLDRPPRRHDRRRLRAASALGTELTIRLPLHAGAQLVAAPRGARRPPAPSRCRILVVDDNEDGRKMLRKLCELQGHEVSEAADGLEAVRTRPRRAARRRLRRHRPAGHRRLRGRPPRPRPARRPLAVLIALSGYGSPEHRERAHEAGFDEHVVKPIKLANLRRIVAPASAQGVTLRGQVRSDMPQPVCPGGALSPGPCPQPRSAWSRSAIRSSTSSTPTARRTRLSRIPTRLALAPSTARRSDISAGCSIRLSTPPSDGAIRRQPAAGR